MIETSTENINPQTIEENPADPIVQLFLEDFAVTTLLRHGRPLKTTELVAAAEGLSLSRAAIHDALAGSTRLVQREREWNLAIRDSRAGMSRAERDRQPLEAAVVELLLTIAKPLPLPVIAREVTFLRGAFIANLKDIVAGVLRTARWAIEVAPSTYFHESFLLDAHAPTEELIIRSNGLEDDPDFEDLQTLELPPRIGDVSRDALALIRAADRPLSHKQLGYLLWKQSPEHYDPARAAKAVGDRTSFYSFVGGWVAPLEQVAALRNYVQAWAEEHSGNAATSIDVAALLRQRGAMNSVPARLIRDDVIEELKEMSRRTPGHPVSLGTIMIDVLEMDEGDAAFVPTLQSLNDKLRGDTAFLPVGIGRFLLRETIPAHVGEVAEVLRPVQVSVLNPETKEPLDFEMSDEGLEGDAADFVHAPEWGDIGEEAEVKGARIAGELENNVRLVILNHHRRAGVLKLRRMDEEFFGIQGAFTRLGITTETGESLEAWASRDSGLIYGLGEWLEPRTPASGGVVVFAPDGQNFRLKVGEPDALTFLDKSRARDLETMRESATYLSITEILQNILRDYEDGLELPALWAQINMVRRTSKRLMASVLSGYYCFYFKQTGPEQIVWRFDAERLDQGFKRNKRKFVRK
jgi:hypothetical protein